MKITNKPPQNHQVHSPTSAAQNSANAANPKRNITEPWQIAGLELQFRKTPCPSQRMRVQLAKQYQMPVKSIQFWFQNRRAKARNEKEWMFVIEKCSPVQKLNPTGDAAPKLQVTSSAMHMGYGHSNNHSPTQLSHMGAPGYTEADYSSQDIDFQSDPMGLSMPHWLPTAHQDSYPHDPVSILNLPSPALFNQFPKISTPTVMNFHTQPSLVSPSEWDKFHQPSHNFYYENQTQLMNHQYS